MAVRSRPSTGNIGHRSVPTSIGQRPSNGDVAQIIKKSKTGIVVDFDDFKGIKKACFQLYQQWENKANHIKPKMEEVNKYNQEILTKRFASLLNEITQVKRCELCDAYQNQR